MVATSIRMFIVDPQKSHQLMNRHDEVPQL
jgi:hypothetical protein